MSEARLTQAMAAASPAARDRAFVLAVLTRTEEARFRIACARAALRGAGLTAAATALLVSLGGWLATHSEQAVMGALWAGAMIAIVASARVLRSRAALASRP